MAEKTGFILYYDMLENIKLLGNDVTVEVLSALALHDQGKEIGKLSPQAQFAFNAYIPVLKKSKKRWEASVLNGGGNHKDNNKKEPSYNLPEPSDNLDEPNHDLAQCVTVNDPVNVNVNANDDFSSSEDLQEKKPELNKPSETKENAMAVFEKAKKLWNERKLAPECRGLIPPNAKIQDCLPTFQNYSWTEIENAIMNYHWHKTKGPEKNYAQAPPYGSLYGFLEKGVPRYFDDKAFDQQFKGG